MTLKRLLQAACHTISIMAIYTVITYIISMNQVPEDFQVQSSGSFVVFNLNWKMTLLVGILAFILSYTFLSRKKK